MDKFSQKNRKMLVVTGEGIECEKEAFRFFQSPEFQLSPKYLALPQLLSQGAEASFTDLSPGDWIFLPGGFSYADHFGSGRLLAYELCRMKFFEAALASKLNIMGVCNGFQVLTQAKLFGEGVELRENRNAQKQKMGFQNQWMTAVLSDLLGAPEKFRLCVRHGEGRLCGLSKASSHVSPFLFYDKNTFDNGSEDSVAGLVAKTGDSMIFGMMPHPEVAMRPVDDPDFSGPEFMVESRPRAFERSGDGVRLMQRILKFSEGK